MPPDQLPPAPNQSSPSTSSSSGSFPQGQQATDEIEALGVSSSNVGLYVTNNKLNDRGIALVEYHNMTQTTRQTLQIAMRQAGLINDTDVSGNVGGAAETAFKEVLTLAPTQGIAKTPNSSLGPIGGAFGAYLASVGQGGLGTIGNQIAGNVAAAEKTLGTTQGISATVTNPTSIDAAVNQAWTQTLGYAPSQAQLQSFVSQFQAQQVSNAEAPYQANRAAAQATITRGQQESAALTNLGQDGVDTFLTAYANAIHGTGVAGGGTQQGPVTGATPLAPGQFLTPGAALPRDTVASFNPAGTEMVSNIPTTGYRTTTQQVPPGGLEQIGHTAESAFDALNHLFNPFSRSAAQTNFSGLTRAPDATQRTTTALPSRSMATAPAIPIGDTGTTPLYGGFWALTPKLWTQAQKALGTSTALGKQAAQAKSAGDAPLAVQHAAASALALQLYSQSGSWKDVAITLAGGTPQAKIQTAAQSIATNVAQQVNDQIQALQNQVNTAPDVTVKTTQPDVQAEAMAAAKASDPAGYTAANFASWGSLLGKMLFGRPLDQIQSTADTFTGPVGGPPAPAPASSPAPAAATV